MALLRQCLFELRARRDALCAAVPPGTAQWGDPDREASVKRAATVPRGTLGVPSAAPSSSKYADGASNVRGVGTATPMERGS